MAENLSSNVPKFCWDTACLTTWNRFEAHVKLFMKGPLKGKTGDVQCAFLLIWLGETGRDIFSTWTISSAEEDKLDVYLAKFKAHIQPTANPIMARYIFHNRSQQPGESMEKFSTSLHILAQPCDFKDGTAPEMIRDRIVCGVQSALARERLLEKGAALTLVDAINITRTYETTQSNLAAMAGPPPVKIKQEVDAVSSSRQGKGARPSSGPSNSKKCYRCGDPYTAKHQDVCKAKNAECGNCHRVGHYAKVCRKPADSVDEVNEQEENPPLFINNVTIGSTSCGPSDAFPSAEFHLQGLDHTVTFKLDTGSAVNAIPESLIKQFKPAPSIRPSARVLQAYGGQSIPSLGTCIIICRIAGVQLALEFFIIARPVFPILGYKACVKFGVVSIPTIASINWHHPSASGLPERLARFAEIFTGIGKMDGAVTIHVNPDVRPVVRPARRHPFTVEPRLAAELKRMVDLGVIRRVTKPTRWVNGMVVTDKPDGSLRVCLDPKDLNEAIIRPHYPVPTFDDIAAKVHGFKVFTKLDATSAYWMLQLDEASSDLTTFNTPAGRYQYTRLAFGLNCAQDILQQRLEEAFDGIDCAIIADDIVVGGKTVEEHDRNLDAILERAKKVGIKFNLKKLHYRQNNIPFFGNFITADGIQPDPLKLKALSDMPYPKDHIELASFLGMVNYMSRFIRCLSTLNQPLRALAQLTDFVWLPAHAAAVDNIKRSIIGNLRHFDPAATELEMTTDASQHGLGAHLSIDGEAVLFASKSLNKTERNYSQIEKELYAIVFGAIRFHRYIYGRKVTVYTDHKPLESVLTKPLFQAPPRLQRMLFALQPYRANMSVHFRPGSEIPVADALSRLHPDDGEGRSELEDQIEYAVHAVVDSLPISDVKMELIRKATAEDVTLIELRRLIDDGFPEKRRNCPKDLFPFWNHRDELSYCDGVILKGERIIIPAALQADILQRLHVSHLGMEKTKERARQVVFWPGLNAAIEELVRSCSICGAVANSVPKEPLTSSAPPSLPWIEVGVDLCHSDGRDYLVTVDYYSRFIEVDFLPSTTSSMVISKLRPHFARYGIPQRLRSDNAKQFDCAEFRAFAKTLDIQLITSSPDYPQSNGQAEKAVDIAKRIMSKAAEAGSDPYLGLLEYRNTPVDGFRSPAQLLQGRGLRSIVPCTAHHLKPATVDPALAQRARVASHERQAAFYNRSAKELPALVNQQLVWVQLDKNRREWKKATVTARHDPSSYWVRTDDGAAYRRNRVNLRPRYEREQPQELIIDPAEPQEEEEDDDGDFHGFPDAAERVPLITAAPVERPRRDIHRPIRLIENM